MSNYETLANAIVVQAAKDYRAARRKLQKNAYSLKALQTVKEVEEFFRSEWFKVLTPVDGGTILKLLEEEFDA